MMPWAREPPSARSRHILPSDACMFRIVTVAFSVLVLAATFAFSASAQLVSTLSFSEEIEVDGLYAGQDGFLYAAGGFQGESVYRIAPDGTVTELASDLDGPIHMVLDDQGILYVSTWNDASIHRIYPNGVVEKAATVDPYPGGMAIGPDGWIYIAHGPPSDPGGISRIDDEATVERIASGDGIDRPVGIAFDDAGNLYAANLYDSNINKIDRSGNVTLFATVPPSFQFTTGHMVYHDGYLYTSHISENKILRISMNGTVEVLAGTGEAGHQDGDLSGASFRNPNGITMSPDGNTLYISSIGSHTGVRAISFSSATLATSEPELPENARLESPFPNPASSEATAMFSLRRAETVNLRLINALGQQVRHLVTDHASPGAHSYRFSTSGLPAGMYFLVFESGQSRQIKPVMVAR